MNRDRQELINRLTSQSVHPYTPNEAGVGPSCLATGRSIMVISKEWLSETAPRSAGWLHRRMRQLKSGAKDERGCKVRYGRSMKRARKG